MTTHYGMGYVDENAFRDGSFHSESTEFNVEKDRSSEITLISDGHHGHNLILKKKQRAFDKVVYESFMMDLWNNILDLYSEENGMELIAPESKEIIYDFDRGESMLVMSQCPGIPIKKASNRPNSDKAKFRGYDVQISDIISYYAGALNRIKDSEQLLHSDYDGRHVLFYQTPVEDTVSLSVIDVENSRYADKQEIALENYDLEQELDKYFPNRDDWFYEEGYETVNGLFCREDMYEKTLEEFNKKFKEEGQPYVEVDPLEKEVMYLEGK